MDMPTAFSDLLRSSPSDDRGAVATEYVIVATAIALVVSVAASAIAAQVTPLFQLAVNLL